MNSWRVSLRNPNGYVIDDRGRFYFAHEGEVCVKPIEAQTHQRALFSDKLDAKTVGELLDPDGYCEHEEPYKPNTDDVVVWWPEN